MMVASDKLGIVPSRGRIDDRVNCAETSLEPEVCSSQRDTRVQADGPGPVKMSVGFERLLLAPVLLDLPIDLQQDDSGSQNSIQGSVNVPVVTGSLCALPEVFYPARRVYQNQRWLPSSRRPLLLIPATIPFSSFNGRTGIRCTTPSFSTTATFWPGFSFKRSRTSAGMTT
jgi:hypothetical protein